MKETDTGEWEYTDEFKKELDNRYEYFISRGKLINREDADKEIKRLVAEMKSI